MQTNWQSGALKAQRRNKWTCALKLSMASLQIWGPADAGNPAPPPADPTPYTIYPWDKYETKYLEKEKAHDAEVAADPVTKKDVLRSGENVGLVSNEGVIKAEAGGLEEEEELRRRF